MTPGLCATPAHLRVVVVGLEPSLSLHMSKVTSFFKSAMAASGDQFAGGLISLLVEKNLTSKTLRLDQNVNLEPWVMK